MTLKQIFNTSAELDYPTVLPTLDLDFANTKALDPRITFTRSTGGSYVGADGILKYAGVNEARFDHNPVTGESLGLLIEESRTNLLFPSVPSNNGTFGASVSVNSTISPEGGLNASLLTEDTSNGEHYVDYGAALTSGTTYTYSVFYKAGPGNRNFSMRIAGLNVAAEIVNVTFNRITAGSIINYGNGWYRAYYSFTASATGSTTVRLQLHNPYTYTGNGTSGVYIWGAQLETGFVPTSYIPTTTSSRTRAADNGYFIGNNFNSWYNTSGGTIASEFYLGPSYPNISSGTIVWSFYKFNSPTGAARVQVNTSSPYDTLLNVEYPVGTYPANLGTGFPILRYQKTKTAAVFSNNYYKLIQTGSQVKSDFSAFLVTHDRMYLGCVFFGLWYLNGCISKLSYYPRILPDTQLQSLTA